MTNNTEEGNREKDLKPFGEQKLDEGNRESEAAISNPGTGGGPSGLTDVDKHKET